MKKSKDTKIKFSEKYPTAYGLLCLVFLLIMVALIIIGLYFLLKFLGGKLIGGLHLLTATVSKMDAVVIVALITGAVSITGVILSSIIAKRIDYKKAREAYLAQKREEPYGKFVEMVYKIQQNSKGTEKYSQEEMINDMLSFSQEITLWGSPKVAKKWVEFRENGANPDYAKKNLFVLEKIMNEMRKDLGMKKMKKGELLGFFVNDIKQAMKKSK